MIATEAPLPVSQRYDLRKNRFDDALERVQRTLNLKLDLSTAIVKRRSVGAESDRGTWVRIELRGLERLDGQSWGLEATTTLRGVPVPAWHAGVSWLDAGRGAMWRADETARINQAPIARASAAIGLPRSWWESLSAALKALACHKTPRMATPDGEAITQGRVTSVIERIFPARVDTAISEWSCAHADLNWANLTGPELWMLDWEDWGMAPRGLDAARLWFASLTQPALAQQVTMQLNADIASRDGQIMALFECAEWLAFAGDSEPLTSPARTHAARLIDELSRRNSARPTRRSYE
jgi:hypothetical protein